MKTERSMGVAALAFSILTFVGLVMANPPGGNYSAKTIDDFVEKGHRPVVFVALYLLLLAAVSLLYLVAGLRSRVAGTAASRLFAATGFAAGTAWAIGAALIFVVPIGLANGGHLPTDLSVVYLFTQAGFAVIFGVGGILLGAALLAIGIRPGLGFPSWLRWVTLACGVLGILSPAFFPFFALLLWGIVFGIWALASGGSAAAAIER